MTISGLEQAPRVLRVLHVEDSELDHQLIAAQLARSGLQVNMERLDSLPAVLTALTHPWDAIISDFNLPGFSGLEVLDALKADGIPVSLDSYQPATQAYALSRGVAYLNDIRGFPDAAFYPQLAK